MVTPVDVNKPSPRSESRGITTAAMLLLAAGVGLLGLESCTQAPETRNVKDVRATDAKSKDTVEVKKTEPEPVPEPMPPPAT